MVGSLLLQAVSLDHGYAYMTASESANLFPARIGNNEPIIFL
jgi:hypothetical protein